MFFRVKKAGSHAYLQLVENHREGRQTDRALLSLGRNRDAVEGRLVHLEGGRPDGAGPVSLDVVDVPLASGGFTGGGLGGQGGVSGLAVLRTPAGRPVGCRVLPHAG